LGRRKGSIIKTAQQLTFAPLAYLVEGGVYDPPSFSYNNSVLSTPILRSEIMATARRLAKLRQTLRKKNIDVAIITKLPNVRYLSDFTGTSGALVISSRKAFFVTDFRYKKQAEEEISEYEIEIYRDSFDVFLGSLLKRLKSQVIGFESHFVSYEQFEKWFSKINAKWVPLDCAVEKLRMLKSHEELERIEKATEIVDNAFSYILTFIKPGITEREIAIELEYFMRKQGAEKAAFDLIIASGKRSAMPHATNSFFKLKKNSFLVIDIGAVYQGYCSDMTRTAFIGKAKDERIKMYEIVLDAQKRALSKISCGKRASEIDKVARNFLARQGMGANFGHNLGHGVGLEIHEIPVLGPKSDDVLESGMVFTVEPGVYFANDGGVRIEDIVVLKEDGVKILTKSPKELIEL
jgi:Xaa-Pro aminopeptidase